MVKYKDQARQKVASSLSTISTLTRRKKTELAKISTRSADDPLRVAILCPYSMSIPGGVQNQVLLLSKEMRSRGIDARIIAPCDGMPPVQYFMSVGTTKALKSNGSLAPIADDVASASLTLDAINSFRPDVIHLHEPLVPGPTTSAMIGADCALVATFHAASEKVSALKYFRHPARGAISRIHERVAVSDEAKKLAKQYLPGKYRIVPNSIDADVISDCEKWPTTKPPVLFVGRHEERKGLRYLIQAWLDSDSLKQKSVLWIAGTGPETDELMELVKDEKSISFLGRIDNAELFRRMRAAHVVVAPALYGESFGIVLLEAMAANACVVATDIPGYRDVARNGVEAILVEPANSEAIRGAVEQILADKTLRNSLQKAGIARSKEFSPKIVVDQYEEIYKHAIEERRAQND